MSDRTVGGSRQKSYLCRHALHRLAIDRRVRALLDDGHPELVHVLDHQATLGALLRTRPTLSGAGQGASHQTLRFVYFR